jgi:hypothetical protein
MALSFIVYSVEIDRHYVGAFANLAGMMPERNIGHLKAITPIRPEMKNNS